MSKMQVTREDGMPVRGCGPAAFQKNGKAPTRTNVRRVAASYDATIDEQTMPAFFNVDAPTGKVWKASGTHALCVTLEGPCRNKWAGLAADAYADVLERMAYGLIDCDEPDCDVCAENRAN